MSFIKDIFLRGIVSFRNGAVMSFIKDILKHMNCPLKTLDKQYAFMLYLWK